MKYIRTKSGIYEKDKLYKFYEMIDGKYYKCEKYINKIDIIKESDKLEDLCDMFVVWLEGYNMPVEMSLTEKEQYEKMKKIVSVGIKAKMNIWLKVAIWTDKGLIYVAKINGEGELELL